MRHLVPTLLHDLREWKLRSGGNPRDLVVAQPDGSPWSRSDYGNFRARVFKKHLPDDAPSRRVYDLRHGYASLLIREGKSLPEVAKRMGNSVTTTAQHYTHVFEAYEDTPVRPMAEIVADARVSAGHFQDTVATDRDGHAGLPKAA